MSNGEKLASLILSLGGHEARHTNDVFGKVIVYGVINGSNVLTIGQGRIDRLKALMPRSKCRKHNKTFIVAAAQAVFGCENRFFFLPVADRDESRAIKKQFHSRFASIEIDGLGKKCTLAEVAIWLWRSLRSRVNSSQRLDAVMELVCLDGDILVKVLEIDEYAHILKDDVLKGYYT